MSMGKTPGQGWHEIFRLVMNHIVNLRMNHHEKYHIGIGGAGHCPDCAGAGTPEPTTGSQ
jgi:hypothetical protein